MKEFKAWLQEKFIPHQPTKAEGNVIAQQINKARRQGWEAALKMVIRHEMHRYGNDFMTDKPMNVLYDFLRKELEDE